MAAIGAVVMIGLVGGAVDVSRAYQVKNRLQYACDAGVLAGRRAVTTNGFDNTAKTTANSYFNTNYDRTQQGATTVSFTPSSPDNGNTVVGTAQTSIPAVMMNVFGFSSLPLSATCTASMSVGNSDVVMVLDTTGSMSWNLPGGSGTRIAALEAAMKNFYDTVATATAGSNARVRYGFVPYSSAVNVGALLDSSYIRDSYTIDSREPVYKTVEVEEFDHWADPVQSTSSGYSPVSYDSWSDESGTSYKKKNQCTNALPDDEMWTNYGSTSTETSTTVNSQGQKVVTETTSQPQKSTQYTCSKSHGKYYIVWRSMYRDELRL